ncbi:hypothetical protein I858_001710 [Planococcus versutus]|uniref:Uncharacterized protein n=2 Tax=Planococcus versutus TaxID=1302659 RepID=A0A1B1RXY4_9BACL|nr:hypothetical protein I858_001710 [Planococcus versutus]
MGANSFELISFVYDNRSFFNLYLLKDTIPGLHEELPQAIFEMLEERFTFTPLGDHNINSAQFKLHMAHGTAGVILASAKPAMKNHRKK